MSNHTKFKWLFTLLSTKEGRRVLFIPIIILIAFSGYTIYQMEFNAKPERVEMQDGSGDILLTKRSEFSAIKLPKEVGEIRDIIGEDIKVTAYDVFVDTDNNIKSATVNIKADEAKAQEIIALYKNKYSLEKGISGWEGNVQGYDMSLNYYTNDKRIDIDLKKISD